MISTDQHTRVIPTFSVNDWSQCPFDLTKRP